MTTGEGGMVLTDRKSVAERAARFVNHGRTDTYAHAEIGHNFRLPSMAAAMGLAQLEKLPTFIERRRENAAVLADQRAAIPGVVTPAEPADVRHAYHQYTVRVTDRDGLAAYLDDQGIDTGVYYPTPIHRLGAYEGTTARTPHADRAAEVVLSLPVHPGVSREGLETISDAVAAYSTEPHPIRP
jgi:dTDP-4-amino-4,6-dideoxygalactose transaminase